MDMVQQFMIIGFSFMGGYVTAGLLLYWAGKKEKSFGGK